MNSDRTWVGLWVLLVLIPGALALDSTDSDGSRTEGHNLVERFVLPQYQGIESEGDPISKEYPHLLSVEIQDLFKPLGCDGWLAKLSVPTRREPPYIGSNHHFEYWGVGKTGAIRLGVGDHFELRQRVDCESLSLFLATSCSAIQQRDIATTYLRIFLAGRIPFRGLERTAPRHWRWARDPSELPAAVATDLSLELPLPPTLQRVPTGSTLRGCVVAKVGWDHSDIACLVFEYDLDGNLISATESFRWQSSPGFPSDVIPLGETGR